MSRDVSLLHDGDPRPQPGRRPAEARPKPGRSAAKGACAGYDAALLTGALGSTAQASVSQSAAEGADAGLLEIAPGRELALEARMKPGVGIDLRLVRRGVGIAQQLGK